MKLIENFNTLVRFIGYLLPLAILVGGKGFIYKVANHFGIHKTDLLPYIYYGFVLVVFLITLVAVIRLFNFQKRIRQKKSVEDLTFEIRERIAKLAEREPEVEEYFKVNSEWLEEDLENLINKFSSAKGTSNFGEFRTYTKENLNAYFSHRVTEKKAFLEILNKL